MDESKHSSATTQIVVAIIGVIGAIVAAAFANWDKLFSHEPASPSRASAPASSSAVPELSRQLPSSEKSRVQDARKPTFRSHKELFIGRWVAISATEKTSGDSKTTTFDSGKLVREYFEDGSFVTKNNLSDAVESPDTTAVIRGTYKLIDDHTLETTVLEASGLKNAANPVGLVTRSEFSISGDRMTTTSEMKKQDGTRIGMREYVFEKLPP
jgi:hypothetical protein